LTPGFGFVFVMRTQIQCILIWISSPDFITDSLFGQISNFILPKYTFFVANIVLYPLGNGTRQPEGNVNITVPETVRYVDEGRRGYQKPLFLVTFTFSFTVLWIRIRSDPKLSAGSGYGSGKIIPDPK
jgi:hypothetical protein